VTTAASRSDRSFENNNGHPQRHLCLAAIASILSQLGEYFFIEKKNKQRELEEFLCVFALFLEVSPMIDGHRQMVHPIITTTCQVSFWKRRAPFAKQFPKDDFPGGSV